MAFGSVVDLSGPVHESPAGRTAPAPYREQERKRFVGLDGLRGLAAMVVLLGHSLRELGLPYPPHFFLAVDFFFLLSGFVVAHAYERRLATRELGVLRFMRLRIARLHPLLVLSTAIALAARIGKGAVQGADGSIAEMLGAAATAILCIPYHSVPGEQGAFALNGAQWSLFAEYWLNPVYALITPWLGAARLGALVAVGAILIVATVSIEHTLYVGALLSDWPLALVRAFFPFFCGAGIFRLHRRGALPRIPGGWLVQAGLLGTLLLAPSTRFDPLFEIVSVMLLFPAIIAAGVADRPGPRAARLMDWAGAISYPLYILHYPIVRGIAHAASERIDSPYLPLVVIFETVAALAAAQAALAWFDRPIRRLLRERGPYSASPWIPGVPAGSRRATIPEQ